MFLVISTLVWKYFIILINSVLFINYFCYKPLFECLYIQNWQNNATLYLKLSRVTTSFSSGILISPDHWISSFLYLKIPIYKDILEYYACCLIISTILLQFCFKNINFSIFWFIFFFFFLFPESYDIVSG